MLLCNGADIGCVCFIDYITDRESGQTSPWFGTGENLINRVRGQKQMTTAKTVGAVSSEAAERYAINWPTTPFGNPEMWTNNSGGVGRTGKRENPSVSSVLSKPKITTGSAEAPGR
jgi:hypothetical protein